MAKGHKSQLKQLKEELRNAGLRSRSRGRKKLSGDNTQDRNALLHGIREKLNPYGIKITKQKHEIAGHKVRGVKGKPAISKQIAENIRIKALQTELVAKKKAGGLIDRRFGEDDSNVTFEEKMLERFTKEKQKRVRHPDIFNLEESQLTHYGQALGDMTSYADIDINTDDDNVNDSLMVQRTHFGGFPLEGGDEPNPHLKTQKEIMEEIISKSKQHKYERQKEKEDDELEREALDEEFGDICSLLSGLPGPIETPHAIANDDKYDEAVREMAYDKRARPSQKIKSEEEIAAEEAEKLNSLEQDRLARMRGETVVKIERGGAVADDLDDDFNSCEDEYPFGKGLCSVTQELNSDQDEENSMVDYEDKEVPVSNQEWTNDEMYPKLLTKNAQSSELAFTFPCPETHKHFLDIVKDILVRNHPAVIQRIRTLYHPKLHMENKAKLAVFSQIILSHIVFLADNDPDPFPVIDSLAKHLQSMLAQFGLNTFPRPSDLVLLTLIPVFYSASDFSHLVVTPAMLVISQYFSQTKWNSLQLIVTGMYQSTLLLQYLRLTKRVFPEVLNFHSLILAKFPPFPSSARPGFFPLIEENLTMDLTIQRAEIPRELCFQDAFRIPDKDSIEQLKSSLLNESLKHIAVYAQLYSGQEAYIELFHAFDQMLSSILQNPGFLAVSSERVKSTATETSVTLARMLEFAKDERKPLTLQNHKAIPIASYLPRFDDKYSVDRKSLDHNRERTDSAKLRAEYRREKKATIRELKSINRTESNVRLEMEKEKDRTYEETMKRARSKIPNEL